MDTNIEQQCAEQVEKEEAIDPQLSGVNDEAGIDSQQEQEKKKDENLSDKDCQKETAPQNDNPEEMQAKDRKEISATDEPPKTKKAALERLRNMHFAAKDPFKEKPVRDTAKYSLLSRSVRDRTSPHLQSSNSQRRMHTEDERRRGGDRLRDSLPSSGTAGGRRRRSPKPSRQYKATDEASAAASLIESRHMRGTMYLLQAEQKAAAAAAGGGGSGGSASFYAQQPHHRSPRNAAQQPVLGAAKPLRERIDALLARPDYEVLLLNAVEIRTLILNGIDLFRDNEHLLSGRKAQLIELDTLINQEKETIEHLLKELPNQFRPASVDEFFVQQRPAAQIPTNNQPPKQQQQQQQFNVHLTATTNNQQQTQRFVAPPQPPTFLNHQQPKQQPPPPPAADFTVPPPSISIQPQQQPNELAASSLAPSFAHQFMRPPPSLPPPKLPQPPHSSAAQMPPPFVHSSSLLFTKPPPTSAASDDFAKTFSQKNTNIMPNFAMSNLPQDASINKVAAQRHSATPKQSPSSAPISLASIPLMTRPPTTFGNPSTGGNQHHQQQQHKQQSSMSQPSKTAPSVSTQQHLMVSSALKSIHSASTPPPQLSMPNFMAQQQPHHNIVEQQQHKYSHPLQPSQQAPSMLASAGVGGGGFGSSGAIAGAGMPVHHQQQRNTPLKTSAAAASATADGGVGAVQLPQEVPRPLMSLSIGPPLAQPASKQHNRQPMSASSAHSHQGIQQHLKFANDAYGEGNSGTIGRGKSSPSMRGRLKMARGVTGTRRQHIAVARGSADRRFVAMGSATKDHHSRRRRNSSPSPSPWPAATTSTRAADSSSSGSPTKRLKIEDDDFDDSAEAQGKETSQLPSSSFTNHPLNSANIKSPAALLADTNTATDAKTTVEMVSDEYAAMPVSP